MVGVGLYREQNILQHLTQKSLLRNRYSCLLTCLLDCAVGSRLTVHIGCGIYHIGSDSLDSVECRARMMSHVGLVTKG